MLDSNTLISVERHEAILKIQFNRPNKKNALSPEMYDIATEALTTADADETIHVVFITGSGDSFTAGNDLTTFISNPTSRSAANFITTIARTNTPIVAAVNGMAVGVGVTMLLHCDLVYAVDSASFNFAFIDLGIVPEAGASYLVPLLVGQRQAAELLMLGEKFGAEKAKTFGIVNAVYGADDLMDSAWAQAEKLASKPPQALHLTKQLLKRGNAQALEDAMSAEFEIFAERLQSEEVMTIMQALLTRKTATSH